MEFWRHVPSGCQVCDWGIQYYRGCAVHIEDCGDWWLGVVRMPYSSVEEHWRLKSEVSWVQLPEGAGLFTFLSPHNIWIPLSLMTSVLSCNSNLQCTAYSEQMTWSKTVNGQATHCSVSFCRSHTTNLSFFNNTISKWRFTPWHHWALNFKKNSEIGIQSKFHINIWLYYWLWLYILRYYQKMQ